MFNMESVGRKIAELRRKRDMTQMELADKLGISFQAVSNWERGNSMPDISKLPELAELFEVTIDELLNGESKLIESIAKGETEEYLKENEVGLEELKEMAGILKPSQVGKIVEKGEYKSLEEIEDILPFLDEETTEKLARKAVKEENYRNLECVAPFINKNVLDKIACEVYEKNGLTAIEEILPFISSEQRKKIADREYKMSGLKNFEDIAPFLNRDYLNQLAKEAIEKDGIKAISNIAPFIGREVLAEYVKEQYL
ncbi:MAG: helix-turn-helix transcriptional regulator [Ruminococcaceae bacterium]|nr:helix-turn-helix transcriptional regulator [Oscillospiraceae bacterium]